MFEKELKNYLASFDTDVKRVKGLAKFAEDAIRFIMVKKLYPEFMVFCVKEVKK